MTFMPCIASGVSRPIDTAGGEPSSVPLSPLPKPTHSLSRYRPIQLVVRALKRTIMVLAQPTEHLGA
ncbi:MAG: hypothetical protein AAFV77_14015, partial [Planctomycetota bacterium]